ncbi:hypothetical protein [Rhizobium rhizogenes]|nr:hypothetical protein [Rhizobium rhizogenes]
MESFCQKIIDRVGEKPFIWGTYLIGFVASVGMSYGFAIWGEPRSYWFWHQVIGVM